MKLFLKILFFIFTMLVISVGDVKSSTEITILQEKTSSSFIQKTQHGAIPFENQNANFCLKGENVVTYSEQVTEKDGSAAKGGELLDKALIAELKATGTKFTEADLLWIFKNKEGKIIFLEKGSASAGLDHVLNHKVEFINAGIKELDISDFIMHALKDGKIVEYQNTRPVYELVYKGLNQKVAITVGDNGFVVGANMKSSIK